MSSPHGKVGREIATGDSLAPTTERVDHPQHYGGKDNPWEAIKVMAAWTAKMTGIVAVDVGNALKYMSRAGKKVAGPEGEIEDIKKAIWYLKHAMKAGGVPVWCAPLDAVQLGPEVAPPVDMTSHRVAAEWKLPEHVRIALFNIYRGALDYAIDALEAHVALLDSER